MGVYSIRSGRRLAVVAAAALIFMTLGRLDSIRIQISSHAMTWSFLYIISGMLIGFLQDLSILTQLYILLHIRSRSSSLVSLLLLLYSLPIILDLALQHWGYPRLTYSDLKTVLFNFNQFLTSFQQVLIEFASVFVMTVYILLILSLSQYIVWIQRPVSCIHICIAALSSLFLTNSLLFLRLSQSSQTRYMFDNPVICLEAGLLSDLGLYTPIISSSTSYAHSNYPILTSIIGDNENYSMLSSTQSQHPLWRLTHGYLGPVRFQIEPSNDTRQPYNVLILNMESWSHHVVGCLTNQIGNRSLTTEFDLLADQGILFTSHYTQSSQTSRTLLTHLFGVKPKYHHEPALATQSRSLCVYGLADILKERGYRNEFLSGTDLTWHDWQWFLTHHSFHQCHDRYSIIDRLHQLGQSKGQYEQQSWGLHDQQTMAVLNDRLQQLHQSNQPYFMDYYSVSSHSPFVVPSASLSDKDWAHPAVLASKGRTSANYKTSIIYSDRLLGQLIGSLRSKGILNHTITIIQGDHGRGKDYRLGANPELHMVDLLDDFQRIPLLILPPYNQHLHKSLRIDQVSSQYDVMATILDILGLRPFKQHGIGQSLMRQPSHNRRIVLDNPINGFELYAAVSDSFKFVFNTIAKQVCIYDRLLDKDELHPDCIPYTGLDQSNHALQDVKHFLESLQTMFEQMYDSNEFFQCKVPAE